MISLQLQRIWQGIFLLFLLSLGWQVQSATGESDPTKKPLTPDVRVIIDISGSMKQNDPMNLRRPALELLVQLFPEGSKAGVWTFGQWVNNLVPSHSVNEEWRSDARRKAQNINSVGLYTNIPLAIETAIRDAELDSKHQTHLILLTDGMVDVSKDPAENQAARDKLLEEIVPSLRDKGVKVHTVALSYNADAELMERLALETDGLAAVAESADDLTRIFLQAFDAAAPAEEVPLEGNRFLVDSSIEEFTALVFKKQGSEQAVLIGPDKQQYSRDKHGSDVRWFSQQNYDLITVKQPFEGEWLIQAELEPSSRVTVVSNLSLQVGRLPKGHFIGSDIALSAVLKEQGEVITNSQFLDLVDVSYEVIRRSDGERWQKNLSQFNPHPTDGVYADELTVFEQPGVYDIVVTANGKTFQRQQSQTIEARHNFVVNTRSTEDVPAHHLITVSTKNPQLQTGSIGITATFTSPLGGSQQQTLEGVSEGVWQTEFVGAAQSVKYRVDLDIAGLYQDGRPLKAKEWIELTHVVPGTAVAQPAPEPKPAPAVVEPVATATPEPAPEPAVEPEAKPEPEQGVDWAQIALYVGLAIGNLLILAIGYIAYRTVTGGGSRVLEADDEIEPEDSILEDSDSEESEASAVEDAEEQDELAAADADEAGSKIKATDQPETDEEEELDSDSESEEPSDEEDAETGKNKTEDDSDDLGLPDDAIDIDPDKP